QPSRIVLDFPEVSNRLQKKKFPIDIGEVTGAVVVEGGGRTRLIVNLSSPMPYTSRAEGTTYVVEVGTTGSDVASAIPAAPTIDAAAAQPTEPRKSRFDDARSTISNIDFRRGADGEGRVI